MTGEPIRRALVSLYSSPQRSTFSDNEGRFEFEGVSAGRYALAAQRPGFFSQQEVSPHLPQMVEAGPNSATAVLKLSPEGVVHGRVTDASGEPLEYLPVRLTRLALTEGRRHWEPRGFVNTDENGRFRFAGLQPGTYYVAAGPGTGRPQGVFPGLEHAKTGFPAAYFPDAPDLSSAAPIALAPGQQVEANFSLNQVPLYTLSGMITGGFAAQGVSLEAFNQSGDAMSFAAQVNPDSGRFEIRDVPPGAYTLKAFSQLNANQQLRAEARVNVQSNINNVQLALQPAITIPVHVRLESRAAGQRVPPNRPSTGTFVFRGPGAFADGDVPPVSVHLIADAPGGSDTYSVFDGTNGRHELLLRNVEPGRYSVDFMAQGGWYVGSAICGATNLLTDNLVLSQGDACGLEIVLRNDAAVLTGSVRDAGPDTAATVLIFPQHRTRMSPQRTMFSPNAAEGGQPQFEFPSLAPGEYVVLAVAGAENLEYTNPEIVDRYLSRAAHVTLAAGQTTNVTLDLVSVGMESQ